MNSTTQPSPPWPICPPKQREVRYSRSFLLDLQHLEPAAFQQVKQFVFEEFPSIHQLQVLPELRQLGKSAIFYRFTLDHYLISIEVAGQIVKFLRILPKPEL